MKQEEFNTVVDKFVDHLYEVCRNYESVQKALMMGNKTVLEMLSKYELEIMPSAQSYGLKVKTLSELLGFDITITESV